jgi:hypothetical protein
LLGLNEIDAEAKIDWIVNTDHHLVWSDDYQKITIDVGSNKVKIWLNDKLGAHVHNSNMSYSMTSVIKDKIYGESIESELIVIAQSCAKYQDEWK